eukprot:3787283-Rhodomonas_salina.1
MGSLVLPAEAKATAECECLVAPYAVSVLQMAQHHAASQYCTQPSTTRFASTARSVPPCTAPVLDTA